MELLTLIIVSFLLAFSFLLAPCASDQINLKKPLQQADHGNFPESSSLPRKLNLNHETLKISDDENLTRRHEFRQASSGTKQHEKEENVKNAAEKETKDEVKEEVEEEESKKSEYFTMDYRWVKKRRPIHNKQIPFIP